MGLSMIPAKKVLLERLIGLFIYVSQYERLGIFST